MKNCRFGFLLAGLLLLNAEYAFSKDEMRWFKNEMECTQTKITIRSYCRDETEYSRNTICMDQTLTLEKPDGTRIIRDLLKKEPSRGYFHTVGLFRCVQGNNKNYLYFFLGNGGNCDGCELDAVMDMNGNWKQYGNRWYAAKKEQNEIARRKNDWFKQESITLANKIRD